MSKLYNLSQELVFHLKELRGSIACNVSAKYNSLNARDKLLRKERIKECNIRTATAFQGTCEKMCPEKERYEREMQMRLSVFEMLPNSDGKIDSKRVVKEYTRSSADQEEPLPHELRSCAALDLTMNYLIRDVASACPSENSQLPSWYDFLWNRTRAIRKEITQQMICNDTAVRCLEKCVRFHVYCAYRLCELDIADFDQRMNNENLTKCMQSLKHVYEDLGKQGIRCENEEEFRAYDILLNLDEPAVMRQPAIRQVFVLPEAVRNASQVKLAMKFHAAYQNQNYVSFFNLLEEEASFLEACILHRYCMEMRCVALQVMTKAYGVSHCQFLLADFIRLLKFTDADEAEDLVRHFGLGLNPLNRELIILSRNDFQRYPEELPKLRHAPALIDSKCNEPVPVLINGGPIEDFELPEPDDSFDESGRYCKDPVVEAIFRKVDVVRPDINYAQPEARTVASSTVIPSVKPAAQPSKELIDRAVDAVVSRLICTSVDDFVLRVTESFISDFAAREVLHSVTEGCISSSHDKSIMEMLEFEQEHSGDVQQIYEDLVDRVLQEELGDAAYEEVLRSLEDFRSAIDRLIPEVAANMTDAFVVAEVQKSALATKEQMQLQRRSLIARKLENWAVAWQSAAKRKLKRTETLRNFPLSASPLEMDFPSLPKRARIEDESFVLLEHASFNMSRLLDVDSSPAIWDGQIFRSVNTLQAGQLFTYFARCVRVWNVGLVVHDASTPSQCCSFIRHKLGVDDDGGSIFWRAWKNCETVINVQPLAWDFDASSVLLLDALIVVDDFNYHQSEVRARLEELAASKTVTFPVAFLISLQGAGALDLTPPFEVCPSVQNWLAHSKTFVLPTLMEECHEELVRNALQFLVEKRSLKHNLELHSFSSWVSDIFISGLFDRAAIFFDKFSGKLDFRAMIRLYNFVWESLEKMLPTVLIFDNSVDHRIIEFLDVPNGSAARLNDCLQAISTMKLDPFDMIWFDTSASFDTVLSGQLCCEEMLAFHNQAVLHFDSCFRDSFVFAKVLPNAEFLENIAKVVDAVLELTVVEKQEAQVTALKSPEETDSPASKRAKSESPVSESSASEPPEKPELPISEPAEKPEPLVSEPYEKPELEMPMSFEEHPFRPMLDSVKERLQQLQQDLAHSAQSMSALLEDERDFLNVQG